MWRKEHFRGFQGLVAGRQSWFEALYEDDNDDGPIVLDRGSFDGRAFARHYEKTTYLYELPVTDTKYDQVFLIELVLPFDSRSDSGRTETENDCRCIEKHLFNVYNDLGLEPTIVPLLPIEERVDYLLERVK